MKIFDVLTKIFLSPYRWDPGPGPGIGRVAEKFLITGVSAAGCWLDLEWRCVSLF